MPAQTNVYGMVYIDHEVESMSEEETKSAYTVPTVNAVWSKTSGVIYMSNVDNSSHFGVRLLTSTNTDIDSNYLAAYGIPASGKYATGDSRFGVVKTVDAFPAASKNLETGYTYLHPKMMSSDTYTGVNGNIVEVAVAADKYVVPTVNAVINAYSNVVRLPDIDESIYLGAMLCVSGFTDNDSKVIFACGDPTDGVYRVGNHFGTIKTISRMPYIAPAIAGNNDRHPQFNSADTVVNPYTGETVAINIPGDRYVVPTVNAVWYEMRDVVRRSDIADDKYRVGVRLYQSVTAANNAYTLYVHGSPASTWTKGDYFGVVKTLNAIPYSNNENHLRGSAPSSFTSDDAFIHPRTGETWTNDAPGNSYVVPTVNAIVKVLSKFVEKVSSVEPIYIKDYDHHNGGTQNPVINLSIWNQELGGIRLGTKTDPITDITYLAASANQPNAGLQLGTVRTSSKILPKRAYYVTDATGDYTVPTVNAVIDALGDVSAGLILVSAISGLSATKDDETNVVMVSGLPADYHTSYGMVYTQDDLTSVTDITSGYTVPTVNAVVNSVVLRKDIDETEYYAVRLFTSLNGEIQSFNVAAKGTPTTGEFLTNQHFGVVKTLNEFPGPSRTAGATHDTPHPEFKEIDQLTDPFEAEQLVVSTPGNSYVVPTINAVIREYQDVIRRSEILADKYRIGVVLCTSYDELASTFLLRTHGVPANGVFNQGDAFGAVKTVDEFPKTSTINGYKYTHPQFTKTDVYEDPDLYANVSVAYPGDSYVVPTINAVINEYSNVVRRSDILNGMVLGVALITSEIANTDSEAVLAYGNPASGAFHSGGSSRFGVVKTISAMPSSVTGDHHPKFDSADKYTDPVTGDTINVADPEKKYVVPTVNALWSEMRDVLRRSHVSSGTSYHIGVKFYISSDATTNDLMIYPQGSPAYPIQAALSLGERFGAVKTINNIPLTHDGGTTMVAQRHKSISLADTITFDNRTTQITNMANSYLVPTVNAVIDGLSHYVQRVSAIAPIYVHDYEDGLDVPTHFQQPVVHLSIYDFEINGVKLVLRSEDTGFDKLAVSANVPNAHAQKGVVRTSSKIMPSNVYYVRNETSDFVVPTVNAVIDALKDIEAGMTIVSAISGLTVTSDDNTYTISGLPADGLTSYGMVYTKLDTIYNYIDDETGDYTVPTVNAALDTFVPWLGVNVTEQTETDTYAFGANMDVIQNDDGDYVQLIAYNYPASGSGLSKTHPDYLKDFGAVITWSKVELIDETITSTYHVKAGGLNGYVPVDGNPGDQYVVPTVNAVANAVAGVNKKVVVSSGLTSTYDVLTHTYFVSGLPADLLNSYGMVYVQDPGPIDRVIGATSAYTVPSVNAVDDTLSLYVPWSGVNDKGHEGGVANTFGGDLLIYTTSDQEGDIHYNLLGYNRPASGNGWDPEGYMHAFGTVITTDEITSITSTVDHTAEIWPNGSVQIPLNGNPGDMYVVPTVNAVANALANLQTTIEFDSTVYNGVQLTSMPNWGMAAIGVPITSNKTISDYGDFGVVKTIPIVPKEPITDSVTYITSDGATSTIYNAGDLCVVPTINAVVSRIKEIGEAIAATGVKDINVYSGLTVTSDEFGIYEISGVHAGVNNSYGMVYVQDPGPLAWVDGLTSSYTVPSVNAVLDTFVPWDGVDQNAHWVWSKFTLGANLLINYVTDEETGSAYPSQLMAFNRPASGTGLVSGEDGLRFLNDFGVVLTLDTISHIDMTLNSTYVVDGDNTVFGHVGINGNPGDQFIVPTMNAVAKEFDEVVYWADIKARAYQDYGYNTLGASLYILTSTDENDEILSRGLVNYNEPPNYVYNHSIDGSTLTADHFGVVVPINDVTLISEYFDTSIAVTPDWEQDQVTVQLQGSLGERYIVPTVNAVWSAIPKIEEFDGYGVHVEINGDSFTSIYGTPTSSTYNALTGTTYIPGAVRTMDEITYIDPTYSDLNSYHYYLYTVPTMNAVSRAFTTIRRGHDPVAPLSEYAGGTQMGLAYDTDSRYGVHLSTIVSEYGTGAAKTYSTFLLAEAAPASYTYDAGNNLNGSYVGTVFTWPELSFVNETRKDAGGNFIARFTVPTLNLLSTQVLNLTNAIGAVSNLLPKLVEGTSYGVLVDSANGLVSVFGRPAYWESDNTNGKVYTIGTVMAKDELQYVPDDNTKRDIYGSRMARYTVPTMNLVSTQVLNLTNAIGAVSNLLPRFVTGTSYGVTVASAGGLVSTFGNPAYWTMDGTNKVYTPGAVIAEDSLRYIEDTATSEDTYGHRLAYFTVPTMNAVSTALAALTNGHVPMSPLSAYNNNKSIGLAYDTTERYGINLSTIVSTYGTGATAVTSEFLYAAVHPAYWESTNTTKTSSAGPVFTWPNIVSINATRKDANNNYIHRFTVPTMNAVWAASSGLNSRVSALEERPTAPTLDLVGRYYGVGLVMANAGIVSATATPANWELNTALGQLTSSAGTVYTLPELTYIDVTSRDQNEYYIHKHTVPTMNQVIETSSGLSAYINLVSNLIPKMVTGTSYGVSLAYNAPNASVIGVPAEWTSNTAGKITAFAAGVVYAWPKIESMLNTSKDGYNHQMNKFTVPTVNAVWSMNSSMDARVSALEDGGVGPGGLPHDTTRTYGVGLVESTGHLLATATPAQHSVNGNTIYSSAGTVYTLPTLTYISTNRMEGDNYLYKCTVPTMNQLYDVSSALSAAIDAAGGGTPVAEGESRGVSVVVNNDLVSTFGVPAYWTGTTNKTYHFGTVKAVDGFTAKINSTAVDTTAGQKSCMHHVPTVNAVYDFVSSYINNYMATKAW